MKMLFIPYFLSLIFHLTRNIWLNIIILETFYSPKKERMAIGGILPALTKIIQMLRRSDAVGKGPHA